MKYPSRFSKGIAAFMLTLIFWATGEAASIPCKLTDPEMGSLPSPQSLREAGLTSFASNYALIRNTHEALQSTQSTQVKKVCI
jgi:hypothetical protein